MRLMNIEAGPWFGLLAIVAVALIVIAFVFTTWWVTAVVVAIGIVIVGVIVYYLGTRADKRLRHGSGRRR